MSSLEPTTDPRSFVEHLDTAIDAKTIQADTLADLFGLTMAGGKLAAPLRHTLQKKLLAHTVTLARAHTRYYGSRDVYSKWNDTAYDQPPDLRCWPLIGRTEVVEHFDELIADNVTFRSICHTSGTTGASLDIYKSVEEVQFLNRYYRRMFAPVVKTMKKLPLFLSFPNFYHGVAVPLPVMGKVFVSGVTDDTLIQDSLKLLSRRYNIPGHNDRITIISGLSFHVVFFTNYLLEQGIDPRSFGVTTINITGGFVAEHWRSLLGEIWGAHVNDRFSLTEVIGGASRSREHRGFLLDPHIIGEVVDVDTHEPIEEGIGLLVLTNLHPFVQMHPLIRYVTGDLVMKRKVDDERFGLVFSFLGKHKNCIRLDRPDGKHWLLFSAPLNELLAPLPDVGVYEWFSNVRVVHDRTVGSLSMVKTEARQDDDGVMHLTLHIELRYAPHCYPDQIRELETLIVNGLREVEGSDLARLCDQGDVKLDIRFYSPTALDGNIEIKI